MRFRNSVLALARDCGHPQGVDVDVPLIAATGKAENIAVDRRDLIMKWNYRVVLYVLAGVFTMCFGIAAVAGFTFAASFLPSFPEQESATVEAPSMPALHTAELLPAFVETTNVETLPDAVQEFDPSGYYYVDTNELPRTFADLADLEIEAREYYQVGEDWHSRPIVPKGSLNARYYHTLPRLSVIGREIAFQTSTLNGVSYRFTGRFVDDSEYNDHIGESPALVGRLIKIKDGKWEAETEVKFYIGGC